MAELYGTIVADPPWAERNRWPAYGAHPYRLMSIDWIRQLPVADLAADRSHLYLWATQRSLEEAFQVCKSWGFVYKQVLTWCKPGWGPGLHYYRNATEFVVFGVRGNLPTASFNIRTWFQASKTKHSVKPPSFLDMVENESPGPRLEMFARNPRKGWHVWGDEVTSNRTVARVLRNGAKND